MTRPIRIFSKVFLTSNYTLPGMSDNIGKSSAFKKLHDNPELIFDEKAVVHLDNIRVVIISHYNDLREVDGTLS